MHTLIFILVLILILYMTELNIKKEKRSMKLLKSIMKKQFLSLKLLRKK